jgi:DnaJ-class molecular chaperone
MSYKEPTFRGRIRHATGGIKCRSCLDTRVAAEMCERCEGHGRVHERDVDNGRVTWPLLECIGCSGKGYTESECAACAGRASR